jgi:hypothetical protein
MEFLRVVCASIGVQGRNIFVVCGQLCHWSARSLISTEREINKCDAFHDNSIWQDTEKDAGCSSYACVNNELATRGIFSLDEFCVNCEGGSSSGEKRETTTFNQW